MSDIQVWHTKFFFFSHFRYKLYSNSWSITRVDICQFYFCMFVHPFYTRWTSGESISAIIFFLSGSSQSFLTFHWSIFLWKVNFLKWKFLKYSYIFGFLAKKYNNKLLLVFQNFHGIMQKNWKNFPKWR